METISANLEYIDSSYQIIRKLKGRSISKKDFKKGFHPAHPTIYARKEIFSKYQGHEGSTPSASKFLH